MWISFEVKKNEIFCKMLLIISVASGIFKEHIMEKIFNINACVPDFVFSNLLVKLLNKFEKPTLNILTKIRLYMFCSYLIKCNYTKCENMLNIPNSVILIIETFV